MAGIRLDLASMDEFLTPKEYVERHLAPIATELHRLTNELVTPGSTAEELAVDMMPGLTSSSWSRLDKRLDELPKHVIFDGSEYFSLPKELLRVKRAKVQLVAVVYGKKAGKKWEDVAFRLVKDTGEVIDNSQFQVTTEGIQTVSRVLPFGDTKGSVSPDSRCYYIEAMSLGTRSIPVCRRFSLSFVYI